MMDLMRSISGMGLPVLGQALGGPMGGMVAGIVAKAIGAPSSSPDDILAIINSMPADEAVQKLKSAEAEYVATIQAQAQLAGAHEIGESIRAELQVALQGAQLGRWGQFILALQTSWRSILAYQTIAEFVAMNVVAVHELWTGDMKTVNAMMNFQGFLTWYFGMKLALLGVYSVGRTAEKLQYATPSVMPKWVDDFVKTIKGGKK
jgi:hypothetical protein